MKMKNSSGEVQFVILGGTKLFQKEIAVHNWLTVGVFGSSIRRSC